MGSNCKAGVNSCIMPGKKVGPNSIIGSGVTLTEDLEPNKIILVDEKSYIVKENELLPPPEKKKGFLERLLKHKYG
jgi:bifunctional UDP-N-acetylglucosamine pyrophosphorylase/glucosamine-1-phosphate N-acetyltransferase